MVPSLQTISYNHWVIVLSHIAPNSTIKGLIRLPPCGLLRCILAEIIRLYRLNASVIYLSNNQESCHFPVSSSHETTSPRHNLEQASVQLSAECCLNAFFFIRSIKQTPEKQRSNKKIISLPGVPCYYHRGNHK